MQPLVRLLPMKTRVTTKLACIALVDCIGLCLIRTLLKRTVLFICNFRLKNSKIVLTFTCSRSCGLLWNCSMNFNLVLHQASRVSVFSIGSTALWDIK